MSEFGSAHSAYSQMVLFDPSDMALLLDLAAIGFVETIISGGPMEQANAFGVVSDARLFQYCFLIGDYAQQVLHERLLPQAPDLAALARLPMGPVMEAAELIGDVATHPLSELPGTTVGELLGEALGDFRYHTGLTIGYLGAEMENRGGAGAALIRRAVNTIAKAPHWGCTPWWQDIVLRAAETVPPADKDRLNRSLPALAAQPHLVPLDELSWFIHAGFFLLAFEDVYGGAVRRKT